MAKRQASNQLNHDNWDQEEEPEDPGVFKKVSDVELSQRVIKTAKRRFQKESTTNPFASFQGFVNKNTTTSTNNNISSSFSNFSSTHTISNGNLNTKSNNSINSLTEKVVVDNLQENHEVQSKDSLRDNEYYRLLKGLNESLAQWIQQHVEKNALCDFTPVFRDYEKHLQDLETRFPPVCDKPTASSVSNVSFSGNSSSENVTDNLKVPLNTTKSSTSSAYTVPNTTFSFCNNSVNSSNPIKYTFSNLSTTTTTSQTSTTSTTSTKITFGALNSSSSSMTGSPSFKFGLQAPTVSFGNIPSSTSAGAATTTTTTTTTTTSINTVFSINTNKPKLSTETFSFNSAVTQNQERKEIKDNEESAEDDDNTEPPKNEFTPVVEKEALYSKRCKLFYSKEGNYVEKGVGVLYLKTVESKVQLLVRADTNLGNILLNIMLTETLPIKRVGKNNVLIVCVPNPPIYPKQEGTEAIPLLIRVKTTEDADELLQKLEEHKS